MLMPSERGLLGLKVMHVCWSCYLQRVQLRPTGTINSLSIELREHFSHCPLQLQPVEQMSHLLSVTGMAC